MSLSLLDMLRHFVGGDKKEKPVFRTEREAYDFCRKAYRDTGGVTPELRRSYEFYQQSMNDDCARDFEPAGAHNR
jgi:hypothetical protein